MSGGGNTSSRGRMGRSVAMLTDASPSEMGRMEQSVNELEARVKDCRSRISQLESTVEKLTRDVKLWSTDLSKFKVEVDVSKINVFLFLTLSWRDANTSAMQTLLKGRMTEFPPFYISSGG